MDKQPAGISPAALRLAFLAVTFIPSFLFTQFLSDACGRGAVYIYILLAAASIGILTTLSPKRADNAAWVMVLVIMPVFGFIPYFLWGLRHIGSPSNKKAQKAWDKASHWLSGKESKLKQLCGEYPQAELTARLLDRAGFPISGINSCLYYTNGKTLYNSVLTDIKNANKFIFIEEQKISHGAIWERIRIALIEKASQGLDIKVMCDNTDSGLGKNAYRELAVHGIKTVRTGSLKLGSSPFHDSIKDKRGLIIIDGRNAYSGGAYITDEHAGNANYTYKDGVLRLEGDAVRSLTAAFLNTWETESGERIDYSKYEAIDVNSDAVNKPGWAVAFWDKSLYKNQSTALSVYSRLVNDARDWLYLSVPVPIFDKGFEDMLLAAASSGVDVRIIASGHTGKRDSVKLLAGKGFYSKLLASGIRIFERVPGEECEGTYTLIYDGGQAVTGVCDFSGVCSQGTAVWLCEPKVFGEIKSDFDKSFDLCVEITPDTWKKRPFLDKAAQLSAAAFGPFLY